MEEFDRKPVFIVEYNKAKIYYSIFASNVSAVVATRRRLHSTLVVHKEVYHCATVTMFNHPSDTALELSLLSSSYISRNDPMSGSTRPRRTNLPLVVSIHATPLQ